MSECVDCGRKMHPADASIFLTCGKCRVGKDGKTDSIRTIARFGSDQVGRKARSSAVLGGQDMPEPDADEREDGE